MRNVFRPVSFARTILISVLSFSFFVLFGATAYAGTPSVVSAKISGPNAVTIVYSEPVNSRISDYTNINNGSLGGRTITDIKGGGTNTITLTYNGLPFSSDATGWLAIASTTTSLSDGSPFNYSAGNVQVTDGQAPSVSTVTVYSSASTAAFAKVGTTVNVSLSTTEVLASSSAKIAGQNLRLIGSGNGPFVGSYTVTANDTEGSVPFSASFMDLAGNTGRVSINILATDSAKPSISSITSNAATSGILKIGDTVAFTLTPSFATPGGTVSGSYNGVPLSWSSINGGATYSAVYTVGLGNSDETSPIQISGVVLTDQDGNASSPVSGSDVAKTIDAHAPILSEVSPAASSTTSKTPSYGFSSSEAGQIGYKGDCLSQALSAIAGVNIVAFNPLSDGLHNNCLIQVIDAAGNASNILPVSAFTVDSRSTVAPSSNASAGDEARAEKFKFTRTLRNGSTGTEVSELQKRLTDEGVYDGPTNGRFGPMTEKAVKAFQKKRGLEQVGIVGPGTRSALNE